MDSNDSPRPRVPASPRLGRDERRGSALIVVLALLGALTLLGFLVLSLSSQEELNAEYFADSAKAPDIAALSPDALFNFVLRQVIIGPRETEYNSALSGGDKSLVPTMVGNDMIPYNGRGINLMWDTAAGKARVDQDFDNTADADQSPLDWNHSPAANGALVNLSGHPSPDVDYTSPDINSPFLSYTVEIPGGAGGAITVRIPSFDRPQYLRNETADATTWHEDPATQKRLLRPHKLHMAYPSNWNGTTASATPRFFSDDAEAQAAGLSGAFPFPVFGAGHSMGPWTETNPANYNQYNLDADPDGDGVNEAFFIDFDFPIQQTPGGTQFYVPLAAVTIVDADGLFNVNVHGNFNALAANPDLTANPFGGGSLISRSNQGIAPSEVNMQYGMYASPTPASADFAGDSTALAAALEQHRLFFGHDPATPVELSNMEQWFLLAGRAEFSGGGALANVVEMHQGRHGELNRLSSGIGAASRDASNFSFAGTTGVDDNNNADEQGAYAGGGSPGFPNSVTLGPFGQPLDLSGTGSNLDLVADAFGKTPALAQLNSGTPSPQQFPRYDDYRVKSDVKYLQSDGAADLMPGNVPATQIDEEDETAIEPALAAAQPDDSIFEASENASLHLHSNDIASAGFAGRLLELAPFNFRTSLRERAIRSQFAATSWDPMAFGKTFFNPPGVTPNALRDWEFNWNDGGMPAFPPVFATALPPGQKYDTANPTQGEDPFRPALRELLTVVSGDNTNKRPQRKLSLNGVLDRTSLGRLEFRPLTPHPTTGLDNAPITSADAVTSPSQITNARQQEYLARRDRQLMCRDIYVMLYTFGGGNDGLDYTASNSDESRYSHTDDGATANIDENYARRMAQLAVNLVDRLDPDDTITVFEYDTDLGNGWNLDDDPYTNGGAAEPDRAVVYGVEGQKLAISEALVLFCGKYIEDSNPKDHAATEINDMQPHDFTFLELENVSPFDVDFSNENWEIVVKAANTASATYVTEERRLTLLGGNVALNAANPNGPRFAIGTAGDNDVKDTDGTSPAPTRFLVQPQWDELTPAPDVQIAPAGTLNLDLMKQQARYRINKAPASAGSFGDGDEVDFMDVNRPSGEDLLHLTTNPTDLDAIVNDLASVRIELRRRVNLNRTAPVRNLSGTAAQHEQQSADNPWVVVDYADVPLKVFQIPPDTKAGDSSPTAGEKIRQALVATGSSERYQPLDGHQLAGTGTNKLPEFVVPAAAGYPTNTVGEANAASALLLAANGNKFSLWQSHFDRDYASAVELFDLPISGPTELTRSLGTGSTRTSPELSKFDDTKTAGYVFVNPDNPDATDPNTTPGAVDDHDNRWYRLLGLAEVPSRLHRELNNPWYAIDAQGLAGDPIGFYRVPGLINVNTVRHTAVLAGLLDEMNVMTFNPNATPQTLIDNVEQGPTPPARDWYDHFMLSRDGTDPITNLRLPGLPSRSVNPGSSDHFGPFRSLGFSARSRDSMEDTILRQVPGDAVDPANKKTARRLFEVGTYDEHNSLNAAAPVHPTVRNRLLQKVLNNTTTRSNVFLIFVQIDYFEAVEVTDPGTGQQVVRIGAKRADSPGHRGFFVVDRSKALDLLQPQQLPDVATTGSYSINQSFNYQSLILYRKTIK